MESLAPKYENAFKIVLFHNLYLNYSINEMIRKSGLLTPCYDKAKNNSNIDVAFTSMENNSCRFYLQIARYSRLHSECCKLYFMHDCKY